MSEADTCWGIGGLAAEAERAKAPFVALCGAVMQTRRDADAVRQRLKGRRVEGPQHRQFAALAEQGPAWQREDHGRGRHRSLFDRLVDWTADLFLGP